MRWSSPVVLIALALAGCVAPSAPQPQPRPVPPAALPTPPPPPPAANWADRPPAPGVWSYRADARGGVAMFGVPGTDALATVRCDRAAARIYVSRLGSSPVHMTLRATTGARGYDAMPTGSDLRYVAAQLAPGDPQLDALAFSRGRILIGLNGAPDLIVPVWPELSRVIEDCRG